MSRLTRLVAVALFAAAPALLSTAPASAACRVVPIGQASATVCTDRGYYCAGVDTLTPDAGACVSENGVSCYVDVPNRPLVVCA